MNVPNKSNSEEISCQTAREYSNTKALVNNFPCMTIIVSFPGVSEDLCCECPGDT
jgi:hypothetical protein